MCDLLGCLKGKLEDFRSRRFPILDRLRARNPIEGVVDFNAVQSAGIVTQKLLVRNLRRIKDRLPFLITETRRPEPNPRHSGIIAHWVPGTPVIIDLEESGASKCPEMGRIP